MANATQERSTKREPKLPVTLQFPMELLDDVDALVPTRGRSAFIIEAVREAVRRAKRKEATA